MANSARDTFPTFIIIGAMRAATTTLHSCLAAHPEIGMSRQKETDFFVRELNLSRGTTWYQALFPKGRRVRGETSPNYTKFDIFPEVPDRIKEYIPNCKLIYVVRDPVERAISHYSFAQNHDLEGLDLGSHRLRHMINTSSYYAQIVRYLDHFDMSSILILDFDEIRSAPLSTLSRIARFIDVPSFPTEIPAINVNSSGELARMPQWFLGVRRSPLISDLRRRLPPRTIERLRRLVASGPPRTVRHVTEEIVDHFRTELAEDARRFRYLTGMPFENWSV